MGQLKREQDRTGSAREIYASLRHLIVSGACAAGQNLPSSRALALERGVSRTTVTAAYDQLVSEGYVLVRQGARPVVASMPQPRPVTVEQDRGPGRPPLSDHARRILETPRVISAEQEPLPFDFRYGDVLPGDFPKLRWRRALDKAVLSSRDRLGYDHPAGSLALRKTLQAYLWRARSVSCSVEQIVIVNGSQQAIDLCARVLVNPGDRIVIEDPCYGMARNVFAGLGAELLPLPCDEEGLDTAMLPEDGRVALAYLTPSHQFPLGGILPVGRRQALLDWAARHDTFLLEDDYDGEYRYDVRPIPAMFSMGQDRVIYVGTLSKTLAPTLRLGYLVVPQDLAEPFVRCKQVMDRHTPSLEQEALASLIEEGAYEAHVRRMRRENAGRRHLFLEAMKRHFGSGIRMAGTSAGLHVVCWMDGFSQKDEAAIAAEARRLGVGIYPLSPLYRHLSGGPAGFICGYAALPAGRIEPGVARLADAVRAIRNGRSIQPGEG